MLVEAVSLCWHVFFVICIQCWFVSSRYSLVHCVYIVQWMCVLFAVFARSHKYQVPRFQAVRGVAAKSACAYTVLCILCTIKFTTLFVFKFVHM